MSARIRRASVLVSIASLIVITLGTPPASAKPRQPDGLVRLAGGTGAWIGNNVYSAISPWETDQELEIAGAGTYDFLYRVQNDGHRYDSIWVKADKWSTPPATCTYKVILRGKNITRKITERGVTLKSMEPGDKTTFHFTITAKGDDDQCALEFQAHSSKNFSATDHVIATVANTA